VEDVVEIYIRKIFLSAKKMILPGRNVLVNKTGEKFNVSGIVSPLGDGLGAVNGLLFTFRIIDEESSTDDCRKQSELTMQSIIVASMEPLIQTNEKGRITMFNPAAERLFQFSQEELLEKNINAIFAEKKLNFSLPVLDQYFDNGKGWFGKVRNQSEFKLIKKDGTEFNAEISVAGGKHLGKQFYVVTIHDLTDRTFRQSEILRAVENEKNGWLEVLNKMPVAVYIIEPGLTAWVNDYSVQLSGYSKEELNKFAKTGLIESLGGSEDAINEVYSNRRKMAPGSSKSGFHMEFNMVTKNGHEVTLFCTESPMTFNEDGTPTKILGTAVDITERKFAETIIRSSEERFRSFFNTIDIPLAVFSLSGDIFQTNQSFASALGYIPAELTGLNFNVITPAEDYIAELNALRKAIESSELIVKDFKKRFIHKNGTMVSAEITYSYITDSENNVKYCICVATKMQ
jgi:PAS domain S-box-containing protein